jgi:hypothetical protein
MMFNKEQIFVEGFAPLPEKPAAWAGKSPDMGGFAAALRQKMKVATVDDTGNLLVPKIEDVPLPASADLRADLERLLAQFPRL